ncbi:MAG: GHKL domain-containing protein [Candidatus Cloacimonetes bacterium]|nr:GHKL domain-containing protein [Candidatus Cloacimonadota bacterium]
MFIKRNTALEKRIFILFFIITFILVITLIFIEWQLARYGINQYEDVNIKNTLSKLKIMQNEIKFEKQVLLKSLKTDIKITQAIQNENVELLNDHIINNYEQSNVNNLTILSKDRRYLFGVKWQLIDKYLSQIIRDVAKENAGNFIGNYGGKLFLINYDPIYVSNDVTELVAVLIMVDNFDLASLKLNSDFQLSLISYDDKLTENSLPGNLAKFSTNINEIVEKLADEKLDTAVQKLSIDNAVGMSIFYNLDDEPSGIFIVSYKRYINQFIQQSILIFILILLAITLIMVSLLGSWFSNTILIPVKYIRNKMQDISKNPSKLEPIEGQNYSGVLGDMVNSFNTMNIALSKHGQILREYKELTDNLDTGIFWLNNRFELILYNPSFVRILGIPEDQISHKNLSELMGLEDNKFAKLYDGPVTFSNLKIYPNNNLKYITMNIRAVTHEKRLKFYGSIIDVTKHIKEAEARKSLELELIKSNKLADIGKRIEGIVHNINSPLNTILGYAQLIKKNQKENTDIDRIIDAGKNIAQTVKGLLTKVKQSNISIDRNIDVNKLISQELDFCKHNLFFKHYVLLNTDFQKNLPNVTASYGDLSLCTANVINNAIQAMKDSVQKELSIKTYENSGFVYIEITDSGEGIPQKNIEKIFETYFSTKTEKSGTGFGLGLAITKNIIEKYRGEIKVESKLDHGTTFTLILPVTKGQ